jgi:hypothetical protein
MSQVILSTDSKSQKYNEIPLNYTVIALCRDVVERHPTVVKCLEAIYNRLFKHGMEISVGQTQIPLKNGMREFFNKHYIPFCKDFIQCYFEMGVIPVSLAKLQDGERIPVVMKEMGYITVTVDTVRKIKTYSFYKLYSKRTMARLAFPKLDKSTVIFSGYGHDPNILGEVASPAAACIKRILFTEKMYSCAYRTEENNSKPSVMMELVDFDMAKSGKAMGTNIDFNIWFGDRDRKNNTERDRIMYNEQEARIMEQYNRRYMQEWQNILGERYTVKGMGLDNVPPPMPMYNLPPGYRAAANIPHAAARSDLLNLDYREEEIICDIFGVPKSLFNAEVRTVGGIQASSEMFTETLMAWRSRLSDVLTSIFKCVFTDRACDMNDSIQDVYDRKVKEKVSKKTKKRKANIMDEDVETRRKEMSKIIAKIVNKNEIKIQFPFVPYDNTEVIWQQYLRSVLTFSQAVVFSKMAAGLTVSEEDRNAKAPWDETSKMNMMIGGMDANAKMVFEARFGLPEDDKESKESAPKKKKVIKKKAKKTEEDEDDEKDEKEDKKEKKGKKDPSEKKDKKEKKNVKEEK